MLLQMIQKLAECYEADGQREEAIHETGRGLRLILALEGDPKIDRFTNYRDYFQHQMDRFAAGV